MALRLKTMAESLAEFPGRGHRRMDGARELVAAHPYVIVYDVAFTRGTILRIWHGAQDRL